MLARWQKECTQRELALLVQFWAVQREKFPILPSEEAGYSSESLSEIMQETLPDYEDALFWLVCDYRHHKRKMHGL
jgi:hypothetical protein